MGDGRAERKRRKFRQRYIEARRRGDCGLCLKQPATRGSLCGECWQTNTTRNRKLSHARTDVRRRCHGCGGQGHFAKACPGEARA